MVPVFSEESRIRSLFGFVPVLLQGCSGTGKSKVVEALQGNYDAIPVEERSERSRRVSLKCPELAVKLAVTDVPGDFGATMFSAAREDAVDRARGRVGIILNVVSFGYHSLNIPAPDRPTDFASSEAKRSALLPQELLAVDRNWSDFTAPDESSVVVLTLVAKPDLWWDRKTEVLDYYKYGEYADRLRRLGAGDRTHTPDFSEPCLSLPARRPPAGGSRTLVRGPHVVRSAESSAGC